MYQLGLAYAKAGDKPKAKQALEKALATNASFDGADDARKTLGSL